MYPPLPPFSLSICFPLPSFPPPLFSCLVNTVPFRLTFSSMHACAPVRTLGIPLPLTSCFLVLAPFILFELGDRPFLVFLFGTGAGAGIFPLSDHPGGNNASHTFDKRIIYILYVCRCNASSSCIAYPLMIFGRMPRAKGRCLSSIKR
ncbi:hypothetical protein F5X96DRAFT_410391 [Biscogniauxia mediterranea]|nr:hypothetical protein F5X96DRAFT_410391 [Biscogniauxia mediterranea]